MKCQRRREIASAAGVRIHHRLRWRGGPVQLSDVQTQLSSSINEPAFPSRPGSPEPWQADRSPGLHPPLALLALFEAIAVAVHFEDVDVGSALPVEVGIAVHYAFGPIGRARGEHQTEQIIGRRDVHRGTRLRRGGCSSASPPQHPRLAPSRRPRQQAPHRTAAGELRRCQ